MTNAERIKAIYNFQKVDRLPRCEFYFWNEVLERWKNEGWNGEFSVFGFDSKDAMKAGLIQQSIDLGWCYPPLSPYFQDEVIKKTDKHEYIKTAIGEIVMYPIEGKGRVMPMFVEAPVKSREDWFNVIKPRLNPETPDRWINFDEQMLIIRNQVDSGEGLFDVRMIGAYMFLRSLCGPEGIMYLFFDDLELVHDMLKTWFDLLIFSLQKLQDKVPFFKIFFAEDIAFKTGPLISPKMIEEFLMPYYSDMIQTLRSRQKEFIHVEVDTDGNPDQILPIYIKNGFTAWTPCEVAAGCDVVEFGRKYPNLVMSGGGDKRILAQGKDAIKRELDRIIPAMKERGGYIPTCDHSVPDDVSLENYLFYRKYLNSIDGY